MPFAAPQSTEHQNMHVAFAILKAATSGVSEEKRPAIELKIPPTRRKGKAHWEPPTTTSHKNHPVTYYDGDQPLV